MYEYEYSSSMVPGVADSAVADVGSVLRGAFAFGFDILLFCLGPAR
jgi:hypothetical protein